MEDELEYKRVEEDQVETAEVDVDGYLTFGAPDGQIIVGRLEGHWAAYSPQATQGDGYLAPTPTGVYRELAVYGHRYAYRRGGERRDEFKYDDPHAGSTGWLLLRYDRAGVPISVERDGVRYPMIDTPSTRITLLTIPPVRAPQHTYLSADTGQLIHVSIGRAWARSSQWLEIDHTERVFVGDASRLWAGGVARLVEVQIGQPVAGVRHEQITQHDTAAGVLAIPRDSLVGRRPVARWRGASLVELMPDLLRCVETDGEVTLTRIALRSGPQTISRPLTGSARDVSSRAKRRRRWAWRPWQTP
jgi:hypothetical protein